MRQCGLGALAVLLVLAAGCSSTPPGRPQPGAGAGATATSPGEGTIDDAHALWLRIRSNAEKACAAPVGDPNRGWLDRALESDGRELFTMLGRPEFDAFAAARDELRARLLFVIKPPSVEDRREAIKSVDQSFAEIQKRRGRPAPASASG